MMNIRELLQTRPLLFDGAMGTYYKAAPGVECEQANLTDPAGVLAVHREYLAAGADAVKTNTFSLPRLAAAHTPGWEQLAQAGWQLAVQAAEETGAAVFADLGPAPDTEAVPAGQVYTAVAKQFAALGADAKILAGIMPVVSQRNAIFMENEINGIHVEDWIIEKFAGLDRAQGEELGLAISLEMAKAALPYADGLYLMTPFNRVALMERLIGRLKQEVLGAY